MSPDLPASVRARLLNLAKAEGSDFQSVLVRYALERFLYRLSQSAHADHFVLKGALLFALWYDMPHRPTRDADLLGFGPSDLASIRQVFLDIAQVAVADGIVFDPLSISVEEIRHDAAYAGARVTLTAELARARCKTQVDIGFGDAITPGPVPARYPVLLADFPSPQLRTYPVYTVVTSAWPTGLSDEFGHDTTRQALWRAFLKKNELTDGLPLPELVAQLRAHLAPVWWGCHSPAA